MSFMSYLAHNSAPGSAASRKQITSDTLIYLLAPGRYIINSVCDAIAGKTPIKVNDGPIDLTSYGGTIYYTMLIDVYSLARSADTDTDPVVASNVVHDVTVILSQTGLAPFYGGTADTAAAFLQKQGVMKWTRTCMAVPAGGSTYGWYAGAWAAVTANVSRSYSQPAVVRDGYYFMELSGGSNFFIDNYNPSQAMWFSFGEAMVPATNFTNGLDKYDGIVTVTLNTIASAGTPTFRTVASRPTPQILDSFVVTAGKRARLIIDFSGSVATAMGVDLPSSIPLG